MSKTKRWIEWMKENPNGTLEEFLSEENKDRLTTLQTLISFSFKDYNIAKELAQKLHEENIPIIISSDNITIGDNWDEIFESQIKEASVIIFIFTENSLQSNYILNQFYSTKSYIINSRNKKLLIPILWSNTKMPAMLSDMIFYHFDGKDWDDLIIKIKGSIYNFFGKQIANDEIRKESREKIEKTYSSYIEETITDLREREKNFKKTANRWYLMGYIALCVGVLTAIVISIISGINYKEVNDYGILVFWGIKSIIIITLLIALSKYSFDLAKSYMCESLKNADRRHAISFGKFFLQAFGDNTNTNEVKEIFEHWNIGESSSFTKLDSERYDPKIIEQIVKIVSLIKDSEKNK